MRLATVWGLNQSPVNRSQSQRRLNARASN